jgi:hypothetical protein
MLGACAGKLGASEGAAREPAGDAGVASVGADPSSGDEPPEGDASETGNVASDDPAVDSSDANEPDGTASEATPSASTTPGAEPTTAPPTSTTLDCSAPLSGAPAAMRRLTARQVEATVRRVFQVDQELNVEDERLLTFRSNVSSPVDSSAVRSIQSFARTVAEQVALSCGEDCESWLLDEVAPELFAHPLATEQRELYATLFTAGSEQDGPEAGARWVIEALLQSPNFLYTDEVSDADGRLDSYSIASRLALTLWGETPDADLLALAANGDFGSAEGARSAALQMLDDPRSKQGLGTFVDEWLDLSRLAAADSRPDVAALGADTVDAMLSEPGLFFTDLLNQGADLEQLMTSSQTVSSERLADVYGADLLDSSAARWQLDPERRAGLLTLPGVLAALSHAERTSPTLRGRAVLAQLLCSPPSPPPAGVSVTLPEPTGDETTRELMELHFSDPGCASCHRHMDGIGFALERFDWLGRSRDSENGEAIDDRGTLITRVPDSPSGAGEVEVQGAVELAYVLLDDPRLASCVAQQWLHYATSVARTEGAECLLQDLTDTLNAPDGLRNLLLTSLASNWFLHAPKDVP